MTAVLKKLELEARRVDRVDYDLRLRLACSLTSISVTT